MTVLQAASTMNYFKHQIAFCAWVINSPYESARTKERAALKKRLYVRGYRILKRFLWGDQQPCELHFS
jgi:hypothetical protein